jgi:hypothetical protein
VCVWRGGIHQKSHNHGLPSSIVLLPGAPQVECRNRRGPMKRGRKVTGLVFTAGGSHLLVSTNDSRCRLLNLDDYSTTFK